MFLNLDGYDYELEMVMKQGRKHIRVFIGVWCGIDLGMIWGWFWNEPRKYIPIYACVYTELKKHAALNV
jgi:hypothetical protein